MEDFFYEIFTDLPRQGPGSHSSAIRAAKLIRNIPKEPKILDIGSGTGMQTMDLANFFGGEIIALDNHASFLEILDQNAEKMGYEDMITTFNCDMGNMPFSKESFDLIWAEGSIFVVGFKEGMQAWKKLLRKNGFLAVTDISWLKENPPVEVKNFFANAYPAICSIEENLDTIAKSGYTLIDYFVLDQNAWWDNYYIPLEARLVSMRKKYYEHESELELIDFVQLEIDLFRKYPDAYGYVFYIMQNS